MNWKRALFVASAAVAVGVLLNFFLQRDSLNQNASSLIASPVGQRAAIAPAAPSRNEGGASSQVQEHSRDSSGPEGTESDESRTVVPSLPTWPYDPTVMEGLVLAVLQQQLRLFDVIPSNIDPIECSETECSIRFESADNDSFEDYDDNQRLVLEAFREAPISAIQYSWSGGVVAGVGYFRGITIRSFTRERQRPAPGQFFISAADILGAAASQLPVDDFDAPPARIRMFNLNGNFGFVMAENICAYDCASDGRQVIYLDFPDTATCAEMQGIEQAFMARTSNGGIDERTFCVPNTLVND